MTADLHVLCAGYAHERVASTVVLIQDEGRAVIVDPGMVSDRSRILDPLARLGVDPADVGDVVFSHHHPDHTLNAALFERARFHDFWAIYEARHLDRPGGRRIPALGLGAADGHPRPHRRRTSPRWSRPRTASWPARTCGGRSRARPRTRWPRTRPSWSGPGPAPRAGAVLIVPGHGAPFRPEDAHLI